VVVIPNIRCPRGIGPNAPRKHVLGLEVQNHKTDEQSPIPEAMFAIPLGYWRAVACINGILFLFGASISLYVYLNCPDPCSVQHLAGISSSESIESYLFAGPAARAFLFFVPTYQTLFWPKLLRRPAEREAWFRTNMPFFPDTIRTDSTN
jgi:hypothetical protein